MQSCSGGNESHANRWLHSIQKEDISQQLKFSLTSVQEDMSLKLSSLEEKVKGKSATILKWNLFIF